MSRKPSTNPQRRKLLIGGAAVASTPFWFNIAKAQAAPIKIGFPTPLTGPFSAEAQDQARAAELAIKEFNEAGGFNGRKAELLVRDDKLNPGEAATRTLELIEKDKVDYVVGSLSAATQLSINAVCKERKVIFNSISQSDAINEVKDWSIYTFHEALNPTMTAGAVARYAIPRFGKKIVFLTADYAYGHEMVRAFERAGKKMGATTLADIRHPLGAADYSAFLPRIKALNPDILVLCNFGRDLVNSAKQCTDFGLKNSMKIVTPVLLYTARQAGGPEAFEGIMGGTSYYWGLEDRIPSAKIFNDRFRKAYGGAVPSDYGALGYSGIRSILQAIKNAKSTDTAKVITALEQLKYDWYKGPEYYRKCDHQAVQSVILIDSKSKNMKDKYDVFNILQIDPVSEENMRSCAELGFKA
ncbi:ABC transporter substrate-binding protein [Polynucleobacter sp. IMCC30063]|uniref:ABC transporter substrate-binding protein n=1 Tax=unclassified Polynucleobacter TaxID=2640945 RepID=UPI001F292CB3|nr:MULTISPECIES: ABC transporter substrate-binding protein [unclassified Polynucleobacter]MCE7505725.1 ABC transporter substrate-binding protein [Polynucleobacter sp. IMCC30063]MCE7526909.1 ABC transporter substrate-binding protein [Polynucleobacter sp. IMCC 30228]MCE7529179.1 ABC transporter substrate-binding protein [Polynucleobacter sp. IMCC 29146]